MPLVPKPSVPMPIATPSTTRPARLSSRLVAVGRLLFVLLGEAQISWVTFKTQLQALGQSGAKGLSKSILQDCANLTLIKEGALKGEGAGRRKSLSGTSLGALVVVVAWAVLW